MRLMSWVRSSMDTTTPCIFRAGPGAASPAATIQATATSVFGTARHARIRPPAFSASVKAKRECGSISTSPSIKRDLQLPQRPERQPCG
ncbi:hypothetical protein D3C81_1886140 [compost metagenome]